MRALRRDASRSGKTVQRLWLLSRRAGLFLSFFAAAGVPLSAGERHVSTTPQRSVTFALTDDAQGSTQPADQPRRDARDGAERPDAVPVSAHVYRIRVRSNGSIHSGSAIPIAPNTVLTARHLFDTAYDAIEVEVQGDWKTASLTRSSKEHDVALVTCAGVRLPAASLRSGGPEYGERVSVYGMTSATQHRGFVCRLTQGALVSLEPDSTGITQGDSGGGVFSAAGQLLGIISAHARYERRLVLFTPTNHIASLVAGSDERVSEDRHSVRPAAASTPKTRTEPRVASRIRVETTHPALAAPPAATP
jgi:S1-C subfamily serine protease